MTPISNLTHSFHFSDLASATDGSATIIEIKSKLSDKAALATLCVDPTFFADTIPYTSEDPHLLVEEDRRNWTQINVYHGDTSCPKYIHEKRLQAAVQHAQAHLGRAVIDSIKFDIPNPYGRVQLSSEENVSGLLETGTILKKDLGEAVCKATLHRNIGIIVDLLKYNESIPETDRGQAVRYAAINRDAGIIKLILANGSIPKEDRQAALLEAIQNSDLDSVKLLITAWTDPGEKAIDYATQIENPKILELFLDNSRTPESLAWKIAKSSLKNNNESAIKLLLNRGLLRNGDGREGLEIHPFIASLVDLCKSDDGIYTHNHILELFINSGLKTEYLNIHVMKALRNDDRDTASWILSFRGDDYLRKSREERIQAYREENSRIRKRALYDETLLPTQQDRDSALNPWGLRKPV
ncbi:MAG: hypothetical protein NTX49_02025 [Chlamydiae bacterium]|nr:hypothetical protein [Chlamydiota bacterium]